jgi:hypothetical protein
VVYSKNFSIQEETESIEEEESSAEEEESSAEEEDESSSDTETKDSTSQQNNHHINNVAPKKNKPKPQNDLDLLLDLNFDTAPSGYSSKYSRSSALHIPDSFFPILSPITANGLTVEGRFNRSPCVFSNSMLNCEIQLYFGTETLEVADISLKANKVKFH